LKGKERTLRALNFEKVDRIPINGGWVKNADFLEKASGIRLKYKFRMTPWENPLRAAIQAYKNVGADVIAMNIILPEPLGEVTETGFWKIDGLSLNRDPRYKSSQDIVTKYVEHLPSPQDVRDSFNFEKKYHSFITGMKMNQDELGDDMLWIARGAQPTLESAFPLFGYQNYLAALIRYKKIMNRYFEYLGEQALLQNEVIANAIVEENLTPFVMLGSDICDDHGPMVSPEILNEIYFPHLKKAIEPLQRKGVKTFWHSDGNITPIFDTLVNIGIDGFQGFQEERGVNFEKIMNAKAKSGKPLIVLGSISVTTTLPFGTVEDVRRDVERCIKLAEGRGGFILMTANVAQPDVPIENVFTMYKHAVEFGKGK